jgi:RNA ligase (TIGR02306 family)
MSNIATIQRIKEIKPHTNSDNLELATVLGWQIVVKKGEFSTGDICVYVAIDSVLPERPEFEFLRNKQFRIKPIRLRGEHSAGICFPLSILPLSETQKQNLILYGNDYKHWNDGEDVSEILGIKHYEKPMSPELAGQAVGGMPGFLIITDEENLRSSPNAVPEMYSRPYYITRKDDGSSGTFFLRGAASGLIEGEFGVCSRRIHLKETEGNGFWKMAHKYDIKNALAKAFPTMDIAVQGECCGPGIQKNKLGLKEMEFHLFNLFDIVNRVYLDYDKIVEFTKNYNIPMVPVIEEGSSFSYTLEELIALANAQKYPTGGPAEGIVIRGKQSFYSNVLKKSWSGKVINENYKEE